MSVLGIISVAIGVLVILFFSFLYIKHREKKIAMDKLYQKDKAKAEEYVKEFLKIYKEYKNNNKDMSIYDKVAKGFKKSEDDEYASMAVEAELNYKMAVRNSKTLNKKLLSVIHRLFKDHKSLEIVKNEYPEVYNKIEFTKIIQEKYSTH